MSDLPEDLCTVIDMSARLPKTVQAGIVAMVKAARSSHERILEDLY